jgi:outer membrane autotransporter protein
MSDLKRSWRCVLVAVALLPAILLVAAPLALASEFSGPGVTPPDPGPPVDPPPPDPGPTPTPGPTPPSGDIYGTTVQLGLQNYTMFMLSHKFWSTILPTDQYSGYGFAMGHRPGAAHVAASPSPEFRLVSYDETEGAIDGSWNHDDEGCCFDRQLWFTGYGVGGNAHNNGTPTGVSLGLGAGQFGFERAVDDESLHGMFGEIVWAGVDADSPTQSTDVQNYRLGIYRRHQWDDCNYYLLAGALSVDQYESRREVEVGATTGVARGDYDGWDGIAYIERGITLRNASAGIQPYIALQYMYLRQNAFTETDGVAGANLDVGGIDANSLRSMLGARYQHCLTAGLIGELRAAWWHEFLDTNTLVNASFSGVSGSAFTVDGLDLGRDWALTGVGLKWQMNYCWSTYGAYDVQFNEQQVFHLGSGGVQYVW